MIGVAPPRDRIRLTLRYDLPEPTEPGLPRVGRGVVWVALCEIGLADSLQGAAQR